MFQLLFSILGGYKIQEKIFGPLIEKHEEEGEVIKPEYSKDFSIGRKNKKWGIDFGGDMKDIGD